MQTRGYSSVFLNFGFLRPLSLLAAITIGSAGIASAQSQTTAVAPAQAATAATPGDPTRPEVQPRLDVDRDPILSPDPQDNMPLVPEAAAGPNSKGGLEKNQNGTYILHTNVDEVLLNCTVVDDKGRLVEDLNKNNFRVWEDGVPQTVNSVVREDLPVSMGILVDNSGSMRDKRMAVTDAAYNLLTQSNPKDSTFIVNFSDRAYLDQGFTSDLVALHRGLSRFDSRGTTAMYDAVAAAADELAKHGEHRKQVLLIITDGADNASRLDLNQTIRRVQDLAGPVVYSIGLLFDADRDEAERARNALEHLSQETGGLAYFPQSMQDVNSIAAEVARDIRNQYTVDYRSTKPASLGGYRTVQVEAFAPNHGKLTARTRKGYYAKPAPQSQTLQKVAAQ